MELPRLPLVYKSAKVIKEAQRDGLSYVKWEEAEGKLRASTPMYTRREYRFLFRERRLQKRRQSV